MGAGIKREVDCEHLVFEADCVGWLLCYHITLIPHLLFVGELREKRGGGEVGVGGSVGERRVRGL